MVLQAPADEECSISNGAFCLGTVPVSSCSKLKQFVDGGAGTSRWETQCVPWSLLPCQFLKAAAFVAWYTFMIGGAGTSRWGMQCVPWWLLPWDHACQLLLTATANCSPFHFILYLTVWDVEPVVTHQTSWLACSLEHMYVWWCRYQQMGNAVCPMVASALGRCLALAALGEGPASVDEAVVAVPDLEYLRVSGRLQSHQTCTYDYFFGLC